MNFEQLSQNWQNQDRIKDHKSADQIKGQAQKHILQLKRKKLWTIGILSLTFITLIIFFISVGAYKNWTESLGLNLMIGMLLIRVVIEVISKNQLQQMDQTINFQDYIKKQERYFKNRQWIHFVFTPIIYLAYFGGFVAMLPVFKSELSDGFYLYILISGVVVFMGLALFIGFHISKEINDLRFLQEVLKNQ